MRVVGTVVAGLVAVAALGTPAHAAGKLSAEEASLLASNAEKTVVLDVKTGRVDG
jgi:hypothetical protein